jgi:hypothetical protein
VLWLSLRCREQAPRVQAREAGHPAIDCYGNGEDLPAVKQEAGRRKLDLTFHGARDHLDESMHEYKVHAHARARVAGVPSAFRCLRIPNEYPSTSLLGICLLCLALVWPFSG